MTPSMMATRIALPLSTPSTLMHIREKTAASETTSTGMLSSKPRGSMGAKISRKMKGLLPSKKERKQASTKTSLERKSAFWRQFVEAEAFVNSGRR
ncbi:hypothetical protein PRIC2_005949 [Phytophthora ramorum]